MKLTLKLLTALLLTPLATLHAADKPKPEPNDAARTAATDELTYSCSKAALHGANGEGSIPSERTILRHYKRLKVNAP
jgi:hypothetical protein